MTDLRAVSWFNRILLSVMLVGGVWCAVVGVWPFAVVFVVVAVGLGVVVVRAAHGRGSDTTRLDAVQPFDERERAASTWSFAVVGRATIIALVAALVGQAAVRRGAVDVWLALTVVLACVVWAVAIRLAVRRA